ncbi:MAG: ABC transporter ATP-binding protein [Saccharofermentanales bacterium]
MRKNQNRKNYKFPPENPKNAVDLENLYLYVGKPFRWWWTLLKPVRKKYLFGFLLTAVSMSTVTLGATITGRFIDDVYGKGDTSKILLYCSLLVGIPLIRSIFVLVYRYINESCSHDVLMRLRSGMYKHLQTMDGPFYDKTSVGDLMARMTGDLDMIRHFTAYVFATSLEQITVFTVGTIYIFSINWILAITSLAFAPFLVWIARRFGKEIRPVWDQVRKQFSTLNAVVQQNISGNRIIKAFVRADYETGKFEEENARYRDTVLKSTYVWIKYIPALDGLANFLTIPVILVGGILVIQNKMTLGGLVAFNGVLFVISNPMRMVGGLINDLQRFAASGDKLIDLLIQKPDVSSTDHSITNTPFEKEDAVVFDHVSFRYFANQVQSDLYSLKDISFKAKKGETIGIIGATGSGKTTLVNLISRFYDPTSGRIFIDGRAIKDYSLQDLRKHIGIVMQEVFLFSDTVEGNIAYGDIEVPFDDVARMARISQAEDFIQKMPQGYDTIIGERGVGLSGGQRQRIALARALCVNPNILILDDTTSAIDMETEFEIQKGLDEYFSDRTVFIVAHRISSVRKADKILVLDKGEIVEQGSHEDLLKVKGIYYDVYMNQSGLFYDEKTMGEEGEYGQK